MFIDDYLDYLYESSVKKTAAGVATALAVVGLSYKVYDKFMNTAEETCSKSLNKQACIAAVRQRAYNASIATLKNKMGVCGKSSDSLKCRKHIEKIITSFRRRIK